MQQPKPNVSSVLSHPSLDQAGTGQATAADSSVLNLVESIELLRGGKSIGIMHNGSLYRLQTTKLGKLILTK